MVNSVDVILVMIGPLIILGILIIVNHLLSKRDSSITNTYNPLPQPVRPELNTANKTKKRVYRIVITTEEL